MNSVSELQYFVQRVCTPLAVIVNIVLIQLIMHRSPKSLGIYKYLMIYIALFEILYAILDALATPDCYSHETLFIVILQSDRVMLPRWAHKPLNSVFCSMFGLSLGLFGLHFIYRYLVITGNPFLKTTTFRKLAIWFVSPFIYGIAWGCLLEVALGENDHTNKVLQKHYLPQRGLNIESVTYYGANYWIVKTNGEEELNWKVMFGMIVILTIVSSSIFTIVFFATMSYRKMSVLVERSSNSSHYRNLQLQLLNSLVAQALIPALLMQGPSCIIFTAPLFHMGNEVLGSVLGFVIALYPVLDPFPTMLIVRHYRNALFELFCKKSKPKHLRTVTHSISRNHTETRTTKV